jgi:hypothetical protein
VLSSDCRSAENPRCGLRTAKGKIGEMVARSVGWQRSSEVSERTVRRERSDELPGEAKFVTHYLRLRQVRNSLFTNLNPISCFFFHFFFFFFFFLLLGLATDHNYLIFFFEFYILIHFLIYCNFDLG